MHSKQVDYGDAWESNVIPKLWQKDFKKRVEIFFRQFFTINYFLMWGYKM